MIKTTIKRLSPPPGLRQLAVSDIHGHLGHFQKSLERARFTREDILFVIGDILGRGPKSLETVRFLMALCQTHRVYPLMGNWELFYLSLLYGGPEDEEALYRQILWSRGRYQTSFFDEMAQEAGIPLAGPEDLCRAKGLFHSAFAPELEFLRSLPTIIETPRFVFVHGGIPAGPLEQLSGTQPLPYLKNDDFIGQGLCFPQYVVTGHWPCTLYHKTRICHSPFLSREQRIIAIDGGCGTKDECQLNVLLLPQEGSEDFFSVSWDAFPLRQALDPQKSSSRFFTFQYLDGPSRLLKNCGEFSFFENTARRRFWGLTDQVWHSEGQTFCESTSYRVPVSPGDILSVVRSTSRGYLVKKDGVLGWYRGRLAPCPATVADLPPQPVRPAEA